MKFKIDIPSDANNLIHILQNNGHSAYVVGGCVRDSILGRVPHDWDICTSATPSEMMDIFSDKKIIETGLQHGTITIMENNVPYEITTYRIDGEYSDGRRPDNVRFTDDLVEDLKRRDFTMNAIAYNDEDGLIDPFNGLSAIENEKIECVGFAKERFNEDALRILRAIRFAAQLDFTIVPGTDWEIHKQYKNLSNISTERINSEFCKIASTNTFCIQLLLYQDVFSLFIPELNDMIGFEQNNPYHDYDVFKHTLKSLEYGSVNDLIVNLSIFFHDFGKPHCYQDGVDGVRHFKGHGKVSAETTDAIMKRLKFDNETRKDVVELVYYHDATFEVGEKYIKRWLNKIGEKQFRILLKVRKADISGQKYPIEQQRIDKVSAIENLLEEVLSKQVCFSTKDLAVNGKDVMRICMLKECKSIGYWLNDVLQKVIDGDLNNTKEDIEYYLTGITDGWIRKED